MARNFTSRAQIVLGYSGYERGKGWLHKRVSFDNLFTSMRYLGYALAGKPYMGIGRNMAYRKELFYAQKGFSAHLNLQRGDDDLFINKTATAENTRIETDANAVVRVQPVYRAKDWREEKISYMGTAHFYRGIQRYLSGFETTTRLLFHAAWITALVIGILNFHWLAAGIAFLLFALRYTLQALIINKTAKDLGEKRRYIFTLPVFDILQPMQSLRWKLYCLFRKKSTTWAVTFAQAGMSIPALGTTHADYFYGDIPCTRDLTAEEINLDYERNTGLVIIETIGDKDPMEVPGIVVKNHGPFAWGTSPANAVYNAVVLDKVAEMAHHTLTLNPRVKRAPQYLMDKHYFRKHGANAYYGQDN